MNTDTNANIDGFDNLPESSSGQPTQPASTSSAFRLPPWRCAIFAFIAIVTLVHAGVRIVKQTLPQKPHARTVDRKLGLQGILAFRLLIRYAVLIEPVLQSTEPTQRTRLFEKISTSLDAVAETDDAAIVRSIAIFYADRGEFERAREHFLHAAMLMRLSDPKRADEEWKLWQRLLSKKRISQSEAQTLKRAIDELQAGWFANLARVWLYERAGWSKDAMALRIRIRRQVALTLLPFLFAIGLLVLAAFSGLLLTWVLLILLIRKLRTLPPLRTNIPVHILYETLVIYLFLTELVAPYIIAWLFGSWRGETTAIGSQRIAPSLLIMEAITALSLIWFAIALHARRLKWSEIGWSRAPVFREALSGFGTYVAALPWLWGAALFSMMLSRWLAERIAPPEHPIVHILAIRQDWITLLTIVLVGGIIAPIIEETVFRGIFYTALRQRLGVLVSAIISASLFALLHPQSVVGACPLFVLGLAFALLYEARRSLVAVVVTHALVNCVSIMLLILLVAV